MVDEDIRPDATPAPAVRDEDGALAAWLVEATASALEAGDRGRLVELLGDLHEADVADVLETLGTEDQVRLVLMLGEAFDFSVLTELDETVRVRLLEGLPPDIVAEGIGELSSDDAVYILEDLDEDDATRILEQLPFPDRSALKRSLDYPEESAGRRMQTDFIVVPPFWTVGQTIDYMREAEDLPDDFYELYVVDPSFRFVGVVPLNILLRAKRPTLIERLIDDSKYRVTATDDQEDVARVFERYNLVSAAVVDDAGRLVGIITIDDVVDVIQEEAEEDIRALGGILGDEEISDSILYTTRSRFTWLLVNLGTAVLASLVIGLFDATIEQMVALAVLMPIVASMGGNAATQTMTVAVRALATRELGGSNARRIVRRETVVGLLNGLLFAIIIGIVAFVWFGSPDLGYVIAAAMVVNMVAAGLAGILVPIVLDKLGADPAIASGVFVTTVTDVVGFFAFLGLAAWWFGFV